MRFAWFILIYCCLTAYAADLTTVVPTTKDPTNQTEIVIVIPVDRATTKVNNKSTNKQGPTKVAKDLDANSTNLRTNLTDRRSPERVSKDELLSALPSTASATTLPATQLKYNKPNREIRPDIVHKSIPIQVMTNFDVFELFVQKDVTFRLCT